MNKQATIDDKPTQQKIFALVPLILTICVGLTIILDLLHSKFQGTSFYVSESFLFSSFWWLFLPLIYGQFVFSNLSKKKIDFILLTTIPIATHLFTYPAVVWLISKLFFSHTFEYWQTFNYELTTYSLILLILYSFPLILFIYFKKKLQAIPNYSNQTNLLEQKKYITSFIVSDGTKRIAISMNDILFLSANSPYINIHHIHKKYLHNETLKSVSDKLDNEWFVQIHKSVIVNIKKIKSYKSRLNGDYDLTMADGTELRISRTYAPPFKLKFEKSHRDTTE